MTLLRTIALLFKAWSDLLADSIVRTVERFASPGTIRLSERDDGSFWLDAGDARQKVSFNNADFLPGKAMQAIKGRHVEIELASSRFLFRTLEFPAQAGNFVEGIVRAQIDRLTPWTPATAVFGCTPPRPIDRDRIATDIAVTPRSAALAFVEAALAYQPASVAIATQTETDGSRIQVFAQQARGALNAARLGAGLRIATVGLVASAALFFVAAGLMIDRFDTQRDDVLRQITRQQSVLRAGRDTPERVAVQALERRKYEIVPATLVLDSLSQALPDHTYATELHLIGNKLQVAGVSADAPSLIRLLEQKPLFSRATFYAPTTRSSSESGERFAIETQIEPKTLGAAR